MSTLVFASPLQTAVPDATAVVVVLVLLSGGLVGMSIRNMFESIMSEEEKGEGDSLDGGNELSDDDALGGGLMDDDDGDDLGGLGGLEDDDLGGFGDDEFGDMDGGGGNVDELEHRLDELENEVGSLSSTVNTVRNENEQISESVGEVEENVRKLLDIYEMVTRGVNPFADDIDAGMGGGMGEGSFGLFADEEEDESDVDEGIAEADAEGFFDEDLVEEDDAMTADADVSDVLGSEDDMGDSAGDAFQDSFDDDFGEMDEFSDDSSVEEFGDESGTEESSAGASFEELKEEYESGEADWADDAFEEMDDEFADDEFADDELEDDEFADDELFDEVIDDELEDETSVVGEHTADETSTVEEHTADETSTVEEHTADETNDAGTRAEPSSSEGGDDGKPYLSTLPEGFATELIVVEWLEFLVGEAGIRGTAKALEYYESIDWIDEDVADDLQSYLSGFDDTAEGSLTIDHHTQSLKYIAQLNGDGAAVAYGLRQGGGSDGIQR